MKTLSKLYGKSVAVFCFMLILCGTVVTISIINRSNIERITMEQLITDKSIKINEVISKLLYKTQTLATLVIHNDGTVQDFDRIAATIIDDPVILNVLLAPDGVVSDVYPRQGNEAVIGLNFYSEGAGNREAIMAKDSGQLTFGGPFDLVQGGQALVGRLPVYVNGAGGNQQFWGLVSVTLRYPQILESVALTELGTQGFSYEIWRVNPDDNERQVISDGSGDGTIYTRYIEEKIQILNAEWYFRIAPIRQWYQYPESWLMIFASFLISFLVAFTLRSNNELKLIKANLENISRNDFLTGISNRWNFLELADMRIRDALSRNKGCYVVMFDMDHFKRINDLHGHLIGDEVLRVAVLRVKNAIRSHDLLARYGGEEFIMLLTDIDMPDMRVIMERIRMNVAATPIELENGSIPITASFGVAPVIAATHFESAINHADAAMYTAKREGRNRVVFYEECEAPETAEEHESTTESL